MTDYMTAQELADYAIALFDSMAAAELAEIADMWSSALLAARAVKEGLVDAADLTDLAVEHLTDLYNDYEGVEDAA